MNYFAEKDIQTLLLINPDNPSGNFIPAEEVLELVEWTKKKNIRFIVDESFVDFSEGYPKNSLLHNKTLNDHSHLVVIKSISKSFGVPGLRLGILASSDKELITWMKKDISIEQRSDQIRNYFKVRVNKRVKLDELFDRGDRYYFIVTFLSILVLANDKEVEIIQEGLFDDIYVEGKE